MNQEQLSELLSSKALQGWNIGLSERRCLHKFAAEDRSLTARWEGGGVKVKGSSCK